MKWLLFPPVSRQKIINTWSAIYNNRHLIPSTFIKTDIKYHISSNSNRDYYQFGCLPSTITGVDHKITALQSHKRLAIYNYV